MKIRIGGQHGAPQTVSLRPVGNRLGPTRARTLGDSEMRDLQGKIGDRILSGIMRSVIDVSEYRLGRLRDELQAVATLEALKLFSAVTKVMDSRRGRIVGADIGAQGGVDWKPLNYRYALWKEQRLAGRASGRLAARSKRESAAAYRMRAAAFASRQTNSHFFLDHRLRAYFGRSGPSIVMSRFGGVQVEIDNLAADPRARSRKVLSYEGMDASESDRSMRVPLGRIRATIFPRLSARLMPGLASGRWTDVLSRSDFEQTYLPTASAGKSASIADKLSGGRGPYRPLVLPITQFFILNRIPDALARNIDRALGRTVRSNAEA